LVALGANVWVAAFDPANRFHDDSVAVFGVTAERDIPLAGPCHVVLKSVCALARRLDDTGRARVAGNLMAEHPSLYLEPVNEELLAGAQRLGVDRRLRAADSLYAATAARLGCPLLSWDSRGLSGKAICGNAGSLVQSAVLQLGAVRRQCSGNEARSRSARDR
jgi:predicted nucleic acid-binding protein